MPRDENDVLFHELMEIGHDAVENILTHMYVTDGSAGGAPGYNPAKAHDYYMRNRQLKGRKKGNQKTPVGRSKGLPSKAPPKKKSAAQLAKERAAIKGRVASLQAKLSQLKKILADLVKQAKGRSGIATKTGSSAIATSTKSTAATKAAVDKSSAAYYDKNKAQILAKAKRDSANNNPTDLEAQIKEIEAKIVQARLDLAAAIKR